MPDLYLYNTLNNRREIFHPQQKDCVRMYVCGPTVYGRIHIGNARPAVVFDVLYRLLKRHYKNVVYARNITDIDDKIIETAKKNGELPEQLTKRHQQTYYKNMQQLQVLSPDIEPMATQYIPAMIEMINKLVTNGFAYVAEGHVLFHVPAFPNYGILSNRQRQDMIDGARVEVAPYKKDPADFVLWKPSSQDIPGWDSPWGRGRPGWHIECSAMAEKCLGKEIDIHGGGQDLIFPHHENEIAQSCCAHDTTHFAHYWLHNGYLNIDGEKMSKSLNNVYLVDSALEYFSGETLRLALLFTHYRRPVNWTEKLLNEARNTLDKWYRCIDGRTIAVSLPQAVEDALMDDINTPAAITAMHQIVGQLSQAKNEEEAVFYRSQLLVAAQALGLLYHTPEQWFHAMNNTLLDEKQIKILIDERNQARKNRDFKTADQIRETLSHSGVLLEDLPNGETLWRSK